MFFVVVGTLMVLLKFADISPVAGWSWWIVLAPFGLAVLWWSYADSTGLTKKREMQKMEDRKEARRRKAFEALGMDYHRFDRNKRKAAAYQAKHQEKVREVEADRAAERKRHADTVTRSSQFHSQVESTNFTDLEEPVPPKKL